MTASTIIAAVSPVADALDALGVPYYLAGSVISSIHGTARATADVDVVAGLRPIHAAALAERLAGDYYADVDAIADAIRRRTMFNVIHLATMMKDGGQVSERQWNDVVGVLRVQRGIDLAFLRDWAAPSR